MHGESEAGFAGYYLVLLALATFSTVGRREGMGSSNTGKEFSHFNKSFSVATLLWERGDEFTVAS